MAQTFDGIMVLVAVLGLFTLRGCTAKLWLATLPGTLVHELAHLMTALITRSDPSGFSLIPKREGDYLRLGSVTFVPGLWTGAVVACAPLLLMPWVALYLWYWLPMLDWTWHVPACLGIAWLLHGALLSGSDVRIALHYPGGWPIVAGGIYLQYLQLRNLLG